MFKLLKELWWFINKNKKWYFMIIFLGVLVILTNLFFTHETGVFLEALENSIKNNETMKIEAIYRVTIALASLAIICYISVVSKRIIQTRLNLKLYFLLREKFLREILLQDAKFFNDFSSGDIIARASGDIMWVKNACITSFTDIILDIIQVVAIFCFTLQISPKLMLFSIIPLPLIWLVTNVLRPKIRENWRKVREKSSEMNNYILENVSNVKIIRSFVKEEEQANILKKSANDLFLIEKKNLYVNALFGPLFQSISTVSMVIALWIGGTMVIKENFSVATLSEFTLYLGDLVWPLMDIGLTINVFHQSLISLERLNEIFTAPIEVRNPIKSKKLDEILKIEFRDLSFSYNNEYYALKNLNLTLNKGETLGIVGKTGSGKTSLVRQLARQYPITSGNIFINDIPISEYDKSLIRKHISFVPQEHILFTRSIKDNIKLGTLEEVSDEKVDEVIELADFTKDVNSLSNGLDTIVGEYGVTLSGGQKQRVSLARAFLKDADVLILDDSLSAVDGTTERNIILNIRKSRSTRTNIIIAHRLSQVKDADKIIVLDEGKIVESGTHDELINLKGWYYHQYEEQKLEGDNNA